MLTRLRRMLQVARPRIVGPITVSHGVNEFFAIVIPPIIPLLVTDLGITYGQAGGLLTVFFLMYSLFQLPAGILADWVGKRRLMIAGLVAMTGGVAIAATAEGYGTLLVAQTVAGIGGSTFHPTGMSIISDVESRETEGRAMGVFGFGGTLGTMSSPLVVGGVAAVAGWRAALLGAALLGGGMTLLVVYLFATASDDELEDGPPGVDAEPEDAEPDGVHAEPDGAGEPDESADALETDGGRLSSLRDALRSVREVAAVPITRGIVLLFFITLLLSLQHRAIQTFTTSYVAAETGASVSISNLAFFTLLVGGSLSSLWAGDLADRFNRKHLGIGAALVTAALVGATLFVTRLSSGLPFELLIAFLAVWFAVLGVVMYASYPVKNALISEQAEEAYSGSLFGIIQTGSALGSASGPALFGALATQWGVVAAFPAIAVASLALGLLFALLVVLE